MALQRANRFVRHFTTPLLPSSSSIIIPARQFAATTSSTASSSVSSTKAKVSYRTYSSPLNRVTNTKRLHEFIKQHAFGSITMIHPGHSADNAAPSSDNESKTKPPSSYPLTVHLPLMLDTSSTATAPYGSVSGHMAIGNGIYKLIPGE
jgi:hypothetical protein